MSDVLTRVRALEDGSAVRFLDHFGRQLLSGLQTAPADVVAGVADQAAADPDLDGLVNLPAEARGDALPPERAVAFARQMLDRFAHDPRYAPALERALDDWHDDYLGMGEILAKGFAASMLMLAANHRVEIDLLGIKITPTDRPTGSVRDAILVATRDGAHFLDAIPFDWKRPESNALRDRLAETYSTASKATICLTRAGVPEHLFPAEGVSAFETWTGGLQVASKRGAVRGLVNLVIEDPAAAVVRDALRGLTEDPPRL